MKTAIYIRTSTDEQHGEAQLRELRKMCKGASEYVDLGISGSIPSKQRPQLSRLLFDIRRKQIDRIVVFDLTRLGRNTVDVLLTVDEIGANGCAVKSLRDGDIDPSTPMGRCVLTVLAAFAEMERNRIRDRIKSGIRNAKAKGVKLGRQKRDIDTKKVNDLRNQGLGWRVIASRLKIPVRTIRRSFQTVAQSPL